MADDLSSSLPNEHERNERGGHREPLSTRISQRLHTLWPGNANAFHRPAPSDESTPLLARESIDEDQGYSTEEQVTDSSVPAGGCDTQRKSPKKSSKWRTPSVVALVMLCLFMIAILAFGFAAPEAVQEYAEQASVFEPTKLSIDSFTAEGVNARVQGRFYLDGSRVEKQSVRRIGRALTWVARAVESKPTKIFVSLPEYDDIELGSATIPSVVVSLKELEKTEIDILVNVIPGDVKGLKQIASDWIAGKLSHIQLKGKADVSLKSGILPLGTQSIVQSLTFMEDEVPAIPKYNISKITIHETGLPDGSTGLSADASISAYNKYPFSFEVPPLAFEILVPGCTPSGPLVFLANATTAKIDVKPRDTVHVDASGTVRQLSETLVSICPGTSTSPLDTLLGEYMHGDEALMYVRGSHDPLSDTPEWIVDILQSILVPVPFSGQSMDNLIRNFSMEDTHFSLPNPLADPKSPEAQPRISTEILVLVNLPEEMNFPIEVSKVRSIADVYYEGDRFGVLDLQEWQRASSRLLEGSDGDSSLLAVSASIKGAPLSITDQGTFTQVLQGVLLGDDISLDVRAKVDIQIDTTLGSFAVRDVPAEGTVPLKPLLGDGLLNGFQPSIGKLEISDTSPSTLTLNAVVNVTNPTEYSANVPFVDINLLHNGSILGNISLEGLSLHPGRNKELPFRAVWNPSGLSGKNGSYMGRALLSQYVSGQNTSISLKTHSGTFPSTPWLGTALSAFEIKIPMPSLRSPPDGDDGEDSHFIEDATMHLFSSTADFTLRSPFHQTTLFLTYINATALYNHTDPVGVITYDLPIEIPPGSTKTPRLPVDWSLGSVGYNAVKDALGGTLKLAAKANVTVRIDQWIQGIDFEGDGIGAHIQI